MLPLCDVLGFLISKLNCSKYPDYFLVYQCYVLFFFVFGRRNIKKQSVGLKIKYSDWG